MRSGKFRKIDLSTFVFSFGTFSKEVDGVDRCLVNSLIRSGIVISANDILVGRIDVRDVGLLEDRLGFPAEWDERYYFKVISNKRSRARRTEEDILLRMMIINSNVDANGGLRDMMDVQVHLGSQ